MLPVDANYRLEQIRQVDPAVLDELLEDSHFLGHSEVPLMER